MPDAGPVFVGSARHTGGLAGIAPETLRNRPKMAGRLAGLTQVDTFQPLFYKECVNLDNLVPGLKRSADSFRILGVITHLWVPGIRNG